MFKINDKLKFILLTIILFSISFLIILFNGNTCTIKVKLNEEVENIDKLSIYEDKKNIVKLTDKNFNNNEIILKYKALNRGKTTVVIEDGDILYYFGNIYVHNFNIITHDNFMGKTNGDFSIIMSIIILHIYALYLLIKKYKASMKNSLYQYQNVAFLGIIIFLFVSLFNHVIQAFNYNGIVSSLENIIGSANTFSYLLLPVAFITSILITISNILLIKKEGFSIKNMLGIILGIFFIFLSILPSIMNYYLQTTTIIDVHNVKSIWIYIENFIDTCIYTIISYLECILLSTIVLSVKASRNVPKYDKDYIIILGCKVNKDGTLTNLLRGRADRALEFAKLQKENSKKDITFITSGGQGKDETISEGDAIANYLIKQGIKKKNIIIENKSTNTDENFAYSYKLINDKKANVAFSTTNYHVFRSGILASNYDKNIEGIGSKTKTYFFINAFIREYIAVLVEQKNKNILNIIFLIIFSLLIVSIIYMSVLL